MFLGEYPSLYVRSMHVVQELGHTHTHTRTCSCHFFSLGPGDIQAIPIWIWALLKGGKVQGGFSIALLP